MIIKQYKPIKNLNLRELPIRVGFLEKLNVLDEESVKSALPKGEIAGTCFSEELLIIERDLINLTNKVIFQSTH